MQQAWKEDLKGGAMLRLNAMTIVQLARRQRIQEFQAACVGAPAPPVASKLAQLLVRDPRS
jgi:hypothetical protein